ncbi:MAG: ABC transporter permease [Fimbriimonadaceae bacterium]|nr:ABC transporter permease [Fimbriimonadaceae bacterium]
MGVIVLAVMLISGIVSMMNSIPYSIRTIYSYSKSMVGVSPRGDVAATPVIEETLKKESPYELDRVFTCRVTGAVVNSIVGKWPFVVLGMAPDDAKYYLDRLNVQSLQGRMPAPGAPEVLISEPVARNLKIKIGQELLGPTKADFYSPKSVKVVGIAETDKWVMLSDIEYQRQNHFPPIDNVIAMTKDPAEIDALGRWSEERFKGQRAAVFSYHILERDTNDNFGTLYRVLDVVIGTLVLVITVMMGMLINIYTGQRIVEFGLLQAIGYTKRQLIARVMKETILVLAAGWVLGVAASFVLLSIVEQKLFVPNAYFISTADPIAYAYTIPVPLAIMIVGVATVILRFRQFDPVTIVERRLV